MKTTDFDPLDAKTSTGSRKAIELREVWCRRGQRSVIQGVNFSVAGGETVALIGPSGGGKSTLLRCLNGLTEFASGEISVCGRSLLPNGKTPFADLRYVRTSLGMIFQDYRLFPHKSVLANVMEGPISVQGKSHEEARALAEGLIRRVGLADFAGQSPGSLSGGQQQRVAIARALAMKPTGLLCDEITAALDPQLKGEVLGLLAQLREEGLTILMVTHEIGFARKSADRIVLLDGGKIIEDGPPDQVLDHSNSARTKEFLQQVIG